MPWYGVGLSKKTSEQYSGDLFLYTSNEIIELHTNDKGRKYTLRSDQIIKQTKW